MAKPDVIDLCTLLSTGQADTGACSRFYDEAVADLASNTDVLATFSLVPVVAATAVYSAPDDAARILGVFYGSTELWRETVKSLAATHGPAWRDAVGTPVAYIIEDQSQATIRIWPTPRDTPEDFLGAFSLFGAGFPQGNLVIFHTQVREDVPVWLELTLALRVLAREYTRDSNHMDPAMAQVCSTLADLTLAAVML